MTKEEFLDFYTEGSFTVRDTEIQFKLQIGEMLINESNLEPYAKVIKKHKSFLIECIEVYKKWSELEKSYTKEKSWSDLVKLAGIKKEQRPRKALKKLIEERKKAHEEKLKTKPDPFVQGRLAEDVELLGEEVKE